MSTRLPLFSSKSYAPLSLILLLFCCTVTAPSRAAESTLTLQERLQLRSIGAPGISLIGQAVVGAEIIDTRAFVKTPSSVQAFNKLLEEERKKHQPTLTSDQKIDSIKIMSEQIEAAQKQYEKRVSDIDGAYSVKEGLGALVEISKNGGGSDRYSTRLASKIVTTSLSRASAEDIATELKEARQQLDKQIEEAIQLALTQTSSATRSKWVAQRSTLTPDATKAALSEILGPSQQFFDQDLTKNLAPEAKAAIANAQVTILKDALGAVAAKTDTQINKMQTDLATGFQATSSKLSIVAKDMKSFSVRIEQNTKAIAQLSIQAQANFEALSSQMASLTGQADKVDQQVGAIQAAMWRTMTPAEQLLALNDGFLSGIKGKERDALREKVAESALVLENRDKALSTLQGIGKLGHFAASLGLPVDTYNLDRNIQIASSAVNVIACVASGNYVGALMQAGGLFPSTGPDPMQGVNEKLAQMLKLQYQILEAIQALSQQLAQSTAQLLSKLGVLESKIDVVKAGLLASAFEKTAEHCDTFILQAQQKDYGMRFGLFPTYEMRVAHFNKDRFGSNHFQRCRDWLDGLRLEPTLANKGIIGPQLLTAKFLDKAAESQNSHQRRFFAVRDYAFAALNADPNVSVGCADQLLAGLSIAPLLHSALVDLKCVDGTKPTGQITLLFNQAKLDASGALTDLLAPAMVRQAGEYVFFFAPYHEFLKNGKSGLEMISSKELMSGKVVNRYDSKELKYWSAAHIDITTLAIAQQSLLSGVAIAKPIAESLLAGSFGLDATFPQPPDKGWAADDISAYEALLNDCEVSEANFKNFPYLLAVCLMGAPGADALRTNVIHHMVRNQLVASGTGLFTYGFSLQSSDPYFIHQALPGLKSALKWQLYAGRQQWTLVIRNKLNHEWILPLPSQSQMSAGRVAYTPNVEFLRTARQRSLERLTLVESGVEMEKDATHRFYLRQAVLNDSSYSTVQFLQ